MNKIFLTFNIVDQTVYRTDTQIVAAGTRNVYYARFSFNEPWNGIAKTAAFKRGENNHPAEIDENGECEIPWEAIDQPGEFYVGAMGGVLITTSSAEVLVLQAVVDGDYPAEPTPSLIAGAIAETRENRDAAANSAKEAEQYANLAKAQKEKAEIAAGESIKSAESAEKNKLVTDSNKTDCEQASEQATQALADLIEMRGSSVATLVGGKVPMSELPASAIGEAIEIQSESELVTITAQLYDIAYKVEIINNEKTISKQWQLLGDGDSTNRDNWIVCGTSYAVQAGNAATANTAADAVKIDGRRMVHMTQTQYDIAVSSGTIDETADYLVYPE